MWRCHVQYRVKYISMYSTQVWSASEALPSAIDVSCTVTPRDYSRTIHFFSVSPFLLPLLHLLPRSTSFHILLIISQTFCIVP